MRRLLLCTMVVLALAGCNKQQAPEETTVAVEVEMSDTDLASRVLTDKAPDKTLSYSIISMTENKLVVQGSDGKEYTIEYDRKEYLGD